MKAEDRKLARSQMLSTHAFFKRFLDKYTKALWDKHDSIIVLERSFTDLTGLVLQCIRAVDFKENTIRVKSAHDFDIVQRPTQKDVTWTIQLSPETGSVDFTREDPPKIERMTKEQLAKEMKVMIEDGDVKQWRIDHGGIRNSDYITCLLLASGVLHFGMKDELKLGKVADEMDDFVVDSDEEDDDDDEEDEDYEEPPKKEVPAPKAELSKEQQEKEAAIRKLLDD
jgi:hypothetical protein